MTLSKSDYMLFLRHPAWLWLKKFEKHKLPPIDDNTQAIFDAGHEFEAYAEKIFPSAVKIGFDKKDYDTYQSMPEKTSKALAQGAKTILQGRFEADNLTCIIDVLDRVEDNTYDLIEIKSSSKAKPEHEYDLAFQAIVLEKVGLKIRNITVIHANTEYVRQGDIDPQKLTTSTDVTDKVRSLIDTTNHQITKAFDTLSQKDCPGLSPRFVNQLQVRDVTWFQDWLSIHQVLKPNPDPFNIYHLSYPTAQQIGKLEDQGIVSIKDVPESYALRPKQLAQIKATRDDTRTIEKQKIKDFINTFQYPLYFFDYETFSSVVPNFDGCQPYADYPFQYSLHILNEPGGELKHTEYLHQENSNPMPALIEQLKKDIGDQGTVLAWYMVYEKGCNNRMAEFYPEHQDFFTQLNSRIKDLMTPFSEMWFIDKDMFGSASVKKVMPVLAPELSYKDLEVSDGLQSRRTWTQTILEGKNQESKDKILSDLSKYCTLDTYAMVRILEELQNII